jgi:[ribosomal protein S18]-alanine N-acetyltransferase
MNTSGELYKVIEIDHKYFPWPWTQEQWLQLDSQQYHLSLLKIGPNVAGFSLFHYLEGDQSAHLIKICVEPSWRGSSYVHEFWKDLVEGLRKKGMTQIYLEVAESNIRAQSFYRKQGFLELRKAKAFYSSGESALIMIMAL